MKISGNISVTVIAFVLFFCAATGFAAPNILNYQGTLTDNSGNPVNGSKTMVFKIYDVPESGTALWSSGSMTVNVKNGLFNVAIEGFPNDLFSGDNRYMEVLVEGTVMSQRKRLASVPYALNCIPGRAIIMWSGSINEIPKGWALCNGENETPDLTNRFIVGAGRDYSVGATGGKPTHILSINEIPGHTHGPGSLRVKGTNSPQGTQIDSAVTGSVPGGPHVEVISGTTGITGGGAAHENRPPYYALCFIMKLP